MAASKILDIGGGATPPLDGPPRVLLCPSRQVRLGLKQAALGVDVDGERNAVVLAHVGIAHEACRYDDRDHITAPPSTHRPKRRTPVGRYTETKGRPLRRPPRPGVLADAQAAVRRISP